MSIGLRWLSLQSRSLVIAALCVLPASASCTTIANAWSLH